jgi:hypothetical protein
LDESVSTYHTLKALHPDIDGSEVEVPAELITQIQQLREEIDPLEGKLRGHKSELLDLMGNARKALVGGEAVARRQRSKHGVSLVVL